jgi:Ca-activated chloride channel family protein
MLPILRGVTIAAVIFIIARPQSTNNWEKQTTEGIDIIMALDVSTSMLAMDLNPNRLEAAKEVSMQFINSRPNDRMGLVVFAGESFTQCPATTDHAVLINILQGVTTGKLEDGTAIGMGLATSVSRLKDSKAKSKVVILLTDGENNQGDVTPLMAAEIAKTFGVRVYTIGVGTIGTAKYPMQTHWGRTVYRDIEVKIDEELLRKIAGLTGGKYFRATDNKSLKSIYEEIDKLEKSKIDVKSYKKKEDEFWIFAVLAGILLLSELLLSNTILRTLP